MAWIDIVPAEDWHASSTELVGDPSSEQVDAIMAIHSLNPRGLAAHHALYASAMSGTATLRKVDRELVAFVVSQLNDCHY
jgi:alkylhydroperoxidase family enzyme